MTKKITKREMFAMMMEKYNFTVEERAFIEHEIELLDRKKSSTGERKLTATQVANESLKEIIMEVLNSTNELLTVTDIIKSHAELAELSNQKVSALMTQLKDANKVEKVVEKRKSYFKAI